MKNNTLKENTPQKILTITILSLFLITGLTAQDSEQDSEITVEIDEETIVDIQPDDLAYGTDGNLGVGEIAGPEEEQDDTGNLFIENLGSESIDNVWFETGAEEMDEDPFLGNGAYDPSNFIALGSDGDDLEDDPYLGQFIDRKEFVMDDEDTESFIFMDVEDGWNLGRFRVTNQEFFFAIEEVDSNPDGVTFRIADEPRVVEAEGSDGQGGTTDLTSGDDFEEVTFDADGTATVEIGSTDPDGSDPIPEQEYCIKADFDEGNAPASVRFIQWNPQVDGCGGEASFGTEGGSLEPGDILTQEIRLFVPFGVEAGTLPDGTLTILAESN